MEVRTKAILALLLLHEEEDDDNNKVERRYWVQPCLAKREELGVFRTIFQEVRYDQRRCRDYIRMSNDQFLYLVDKMSEDLQKQDTVLRNCISPEELTCLALRYLATRETFRSLEFQFRISKIRIFPKQ